MVAKDIYKKLLCVVVFPLFCAVVLSGCDPVLPSNDIVAELSPRELSVGSTSEIIITYPNIENTAISAWKDPVIRVVSGKDFVEMAGLTVTGKKAGQTILEISVYAECSYFGIVIDEKLFITELVINVSD